MSKTWLRFFVNPERQKYWAYSHNVTVLRGAQKNSGVSYDWAPSSRSCAYLRGGVFGLCGRRAESVGKAAAEILAIDPNQQHMKK